DVYGLTFTPRDTSAGLLAMALVYGQMTDPRSPLSLVLRAGGARLDPDGIARTQVYPLRPHPAAERLVTGRREWRSPWRPDEPRRESFAELCDRAVAETLGCLTAVEAVAFGGADADALLARIADRGMLSGEPCGSARRALAFAPDREQVWEQS
ncbi:MAG TPA: hypothetical protein VK576_05885, partial [Thermoleophilia bacterium]|nr:hypothetical protein [Thermoleophilia bacterium]